MTRGPRVLSAALAVVLATSLIGIPAYAAEPKSDPLPEAQRSVTDQPVGEVRVKLVEGRAAAAGADLAVTLSGPGGFQKSEAVSLAASGSQGAARFDGLADGAYELSVAAPGFATYRQQVEVSGDASSLEVHTGDLSPEEGMAHPGLIVSGDADGDGEVGEADATAVIDALEAESFDPACDFDDDGSVTLVDLQIAAERFGAAQVDATVARSVPPAAIAVEVGEGFEVSSDPSALLAGDELVSFAGTAPITDENPVRIAFDLASEGVQAPEVGGMVINVPPRSDNAIAEGSIIVELEDGSEFDVAISAPLKWSFRSRAATPTATVDEGGAIVIDFGGQVAVKKVTLVITKTAGATNLAEVSKVEFLNDMESHIPEPDLSIPANLVAAPGSKKFDVSWDAQVNVTGYELSISANGVEEVKRTAATALSVSSFNGGKIKNGTEFSIRVRSANGAWRSPWSEAVSVVPVASAAPDAPEGLKLEGGYRSIAASWKSMEDTDSYNLFYREKADESAPFAKVEGIASASRKLEGLKDDTEYLVHVTGVNEIGESAPSLDAVARTTSVEPAQLPGYRLVNVPDADGRHLAHIASAAHAQGSMVDSPLDDASGDPKSALGLFDGDFASHLRVDNWDNGGYDGGNRNKGVRVTFDEPQTLGMISFAEVVNGGDYGYLSVQYVDAQGAWKRAPASLLTRVDANGRKFSLVKLAEPIATSEVNVGIGRYNPQVGNVVIAEMRFHAYDSLEDDIMALYADDLHLVLQEGVTAATVEALQGRLDAPDEVTGDFHPFRGALQRELDNARTLLETPGLDDTVRVRNAISAARDNRGLGIGGLNAWQPLGATAAAGDQIVVYVGAPGKATGSSAPLRLVAAQQHPESGAVAKVAASLKVGRNEVTVPSLSSTDVERGGQLYIEYTGANDADAWGVRVSGATAAPVLDLYRVDDPAERLARTTAYVEELESHVAGLAQTHDERHAASENASVRYGFDEKNCIANATDVMLDQMLYSVPAQQVLAGAGAGSTAERAQRLLASLDAMDQMMELFYQHKGLTGSFAPGTDAAVVKANSLPSQHLNIRYTRMFAGAFMYAAGNHIGIEWGSVPGLAKGVPYALDDSGAKASGSLFGWGIAHEIGHNINQGQYALAEVTNNYFAQLARTDETNASARFKYADVYDRVTSGERGRAGSVFTQLAMYWQLRLAYDAGGAYETYGTYQDLFENRFFARVDSYARAPRTAPAPGGVALALGGGEAQNIMKLASAAAERDLTEFFARWGLEPDEGTAAYMAQFEPEARAICYASDDARAYARAHEDAGAVAGKDVVEASVAVDGSQVALALGADASAGDSVLGYEIARLTIADGTRQREVVGFSTEPAFVDNASSLGNRTVAYEVTAVDKFLNRSAPRALDPVKLAGDGRHGKDGWTVATNMASAQDVVPPTSEEDPDVPEPLPASALAVDGDAATVFTGTSANADPTMTIDLGKPTAVTALRYALQGAAEGAPLSAYRIEASLDGATYATVKEGELALGADGTATLYFENGEDPWICTYDARYLRITGTGQAGRAVSVGEIDVFGPSGDDVGLAEIDGVPAIGVLKSDFEYQPAGEGQDKLFIPKGSVVFTGSYKGNPAYNVVVLYDEAGDVVGGADADGNTVASQIVLAPPPGDAMLGETSEGRWAYWIEPGQLAGAELPARVRAELYRVDNALTNEGQRLTSDSLFASVPEALPEIELSGAMAPVSD